MKKKYILIVEDERVQSKLFNQIVADVEYKGLSLSSGLDFISFMRDNKDILNVSKEDIALVLLDFHLKDMDATTALQELKDLGNKIPVVVLSADNNPDNIVSTVKLGADNFFIKGKKEDLGRLFAYINNLS